MKTCLKHFWNVKNLNCKLKIVLLRLPGLKSNQLEQNVKYNIPRLGELQQQAAQASIEASMSLDGELDQQYFAHNIHNTKNLGISTVSFISNPLHIFITRRILEP